MWIAGINAAAAELLRFCAFLAPDAIPEELFSESAADLGPTLEPVATDPTMLNSAIRELLKDQMDEETQHLWAERTVRAVNLVFPEVEYENWLRCQQFIPHVLVCKALIKQWDMTLPEATQLLDNTGNYLTESAQYEQAGPLYLRALAIRERMLGSETLYQRALKIKEKTLPPDHPSIANTLENYASLLQKMNRTLEAATLKERAREIRAKRSS